VCSLYLEFYNEGDERKKLGLPVVEMMDRFKENNKWDIQIGFCTFVLKELYENFGKCFSEAKHVVIAIEENLENFRKEKEKCLKIA